MKLIHLVSIQREPWRLACPFSVLWCRMARVLHHSQCRTPTACPSWRSSSDSSSNRLPRNSRVGWWQVQARHPSCTTHRSPRPRHCQATRHFITHLSPLWPPSLLPHRPQRALALFPNYSELFSCHHCTILLETLLIAFQTKKLLNIFAMMIILKILTWL